MNGRNGALIIAVLLILASFSVSTLAKVGFKPNYEATFSGDITGGGPVEVIGYFIEIRSNPAKNDFILTFGEVFGEFAGTHYGYLYIKRKSATDPCAEIHYTFGPEDGNFYHLHGFGVFEGNKREGWFRIVSKGEFTISESGPDGEWVLVWTGEPSFTIEGEEL